ncbi:uncharacterized protein FIBRA_08654 [Fibroporia radiculosa]|uniref:DUF6534 domain-containing protein n=1 Tax=Fibroporia radiculosa TaxID=599839 RepID=J4GX74_9APHY|nr:uncharacterized protein FIBRA_08654 [Fibroporia radiculosa]CCM06395.1 predicted protein [Fibroporia radiculosa]
MPSIGSSSIEEFMGGLIVCIDIAILLYGIVTAQTYFYWWASHEDSKLLRSLVASVWFLETLHTLFCIHMAYYYTIISFGDMNGVRQLVWSAAATTFTEARFRGRTFMCSLATSHNLLAKLFDLANLDIESKIYGSDRRTGKSSSESGTYLSLSIAKAIVLFMRIAAGFAATSFMWEIDTWAKFATFYGARIACTCALVLSGVLDALIALSQIYYLWTSRTGYQVTDNLVRKLMTYVINTGALTMFVTMAAIATFWAPALSGRSLVFVGLVEIQSQLYANTLIAALNTRQHHGLATGRQHSSNLVEIGLHPSPLIDDVGPAKHPDTM